MKNKKKEIVNEDYLTRVVINNPSSVDEKDLIRIASKSGKGHTGYGLSQENSDIENPQ